MTKLEIELLAALELLANEIAAPGLEDNVPHDCLIETDISYGAILNAWNAIAKAKEQSK
jgi:hypothetical protein